MKKEDIETAVDELSKKLISEGKLIEFGFQTLRKVAISPSAPQIQIDEMRMAFFAGAQHVFATLMSTLDPESEPTTEDMLRLENIMKELDAFASVLQEKITKKP